MNSNSRTRFTRRPLLAWALACALAAAASAGIVQSQSVAPRYLLNVPAAALAEVVARHQLAVDDDELSDQGVYRVRDLADRSPEALVLELQGDLIVVGFELDSVEKITEVAPFTVNQSTEAILETFRQSSMVPYYGASVPSGYVSQPASTVIGLSPAHAYGVGSVVVAVIDTGVDPNHPALRGALIPGYDFTRDLPGPASELADLAPPTAAALQQSTEAILEGLGAFGLGSSAAAFLQQSTEAILEGGGGVPAAFGHGTMVAGLVHLVAPGARIMPLKAFRADGSTSLFDIIRALYYATDHGARVVNMSFSMASRSPEVDRALGYAHSRGVLMVSSAGNDGKRLEVYPATSSKVLGTASTTNTDQRSVFSNYGAATVTLAAPGEGLITTFPGGGYAAVWGTSFSAGLVSGGAALLSHEVAPALAYQDADAAESNLRNASRLTKDLGKGRLDLKKAVDAMLAD